MDDLSAAFDDNGWSVGNVGPAPGGPHLTLFTASAPAKLGARELDRIAKDLAGASISILPEKKYPRGASPNADVALASVELADAGPARALVRAYPVTRGLEQKARALESARAMGGAGMDWLVARAVRTIEVVPASGASDAHVWVLAFALATMDLAAIHPPEGGVVFGPKTARERLAKLGLKLR
ncbi:MAG TPA: hypothetical protein VL400_00795 [Polyangiaceae bacterium]|nr:hypothetical protein [Polyangiaceae bacterium]